MVEAATPSGYGEKHRVTTQVSQHPGSQLLQDRIAPLWQILEHLRAWLLATPPHHVKVLEQLRRYNLLDFTHAVVEGLLALKQDISNDRRKLESSLPAETNHELDDAKSSLDVTGDKPQVAPTAGQGREELRVDKRVIEEGPMDPIFKPEYTYYTLKIEGHIGSLNSVHSKQPHTTQVLGKRQRRVGSDGSHVARKKQRTIRDSLSRQQWLGSPPTSRSDMRPAGRQSPVVPPTSPYGMQGGPTRGQSAVAPVPDSVSSPFVTESMDLDETVYQPSTTIPEANTHLQEAVVSDYTSESTLSSAKYVSSIASSSPSVSRAPDEPPAAQEPEEQPDPEAPAVLPTITEEIVAKICQDFERLEKLCEENPNPDAEAIELLLPLATEMAIAICNLDIHAAMADLDNYDDLLAQQVAIQEEIAELAVDEAQLTAVGDWETVGALGERVDDLEDENETIEGRMAAAVEAGVFYENGLVIKERVVLQLRSWLLDLSKFAARAEYGYEGKTVRNGVQSI